MKHKLLLSLLITSSMASVSAQKISAYAITSAEKGQSGWSEVKLVDILTGEVVKPIYSAADEVSTLNARTKKPIVKKEVSYSGVISTSAPISIGAKRQVVAISGDNNSVSLPGEVQAPDRVQLVDEERATTTGGQRTRVNSLKNLTELRDLRTTIQRKISTRLSTVQSEKPFATNSAACAYDKKHDRLYYTPLGINQLRYIDLKTNNIYYFEDDNFGALSSRFDVPNQITRMVIGSDGHGYALSNNSKHLIKFTTNKKAVITDLGSLIDDPANGNNSINSAGGYGGDMIAGDRGSLYLITAKKTVFKFDADTKVATYLGSIKGLPSGYSTNGAIVEKGTTIIVSSANSTQGYYKFDLNTLQAEPLPNKGSVYNASDLANGRLVSEKKRKTDKQTETVTEEQPTAQQDKNVFLDLLQKKIAIYPNPVVMGGTIKLAFADQPKGRYTIQLMDISGKLLDARQVNISNKNQIEEYRLPSTLFGKGNYLVKVVGDQKKIVSVNTIIVQ